MQLNFWKVLFAWPVFFFLQFRIRWLFYRFNKQIKFRKRRVKERKRYLFVRRYSKILFWFYNSRTNFSGLENWKFSATVLLLKTVNPLMPLFFTKSNDFSKTAPLSFCFTKTYLQLLPPTCKKFYLLLNHFILTEHNLLPALKNQILTNLQTPRTLLIIAPNASEKITKFIANLLGSSLPNLHFIKSTKTDKIKLTFVESYDTRQMLRINHHFIEKKVHRFFN